MNAKVLKFIGWLVVCMIIIIMFQWILLRMSVNEKSMLIIKQACFSIYMFTPTFAAIITEKGNIKKLISEYRITLKNINVKKLIQYFAATAILIPLLILFITYILGNIGGIGYLGQILWGHNSSYFNNIILPDNFFLKFGSLVLISLGLNVFVGLVSNIIPTFGGEIGWRGFLQNNITFSDTKKSLFIGFIWGFWNIPLILLNTGKNLNEYLATICVKILLCIACSFYFTKALRETRTLFAPIVMQGLISSCSLIFLIGGYANYLIAGTQGLVSVVSIMLVNMLFLRKSSLFRQRNVSGKVCAVV